MNRSMISILFLTACSLQTSAATDTGPALPAAPAAASVAAPASAAGACDAANDHCLPSGVQFSDHNQREGGRGPVIACVERDGTWRSLQSDSVCEGPAFHRTEPATAANLAVGALVVKYSATTREPDGVPENEERARVGRWIIGKVESVDAERGTFRRRTDHADSPIAGARVVVETRTVGD